MRKKFYRVNHENTQQGLWYDFSGDFTGLIHDRFDFCKNHRLGMDFDAEVVGYISATETLEQLSQWFTRDDILRLQEHGFFIHEYSATDFKWYSRFSHYLINQETSIAVRKIAISESTDLALIT